MSRFFISVCICLLPMLAFGAGAFGADLNSENDAEVLAQSVMRDVVSGSFINGLERLRPYNVYTKEEFDAALNDIKGQLADMDSRFGKSIGYDFVTVEKVGASLRQFVYLQKFERHLLVWRFIFYKPRDQWQLNTFYFDDKVQMLFVY